jgi:hypothetical protein
MRRVIAQILSITVYSHIRDPQRACFSAIYDTYLLVFSVPQFHYVHSCIVSVRNNLSLLEEPYLVQPAPYCLPLSKAHVHNVSK